MKKSKKESKLTLEDLINDTYTLSKYIKNLNNIDIKDLNLEEISKKTKHFDEKYKDIFKQNPPKDVDTEE